MGTPLTNETIDPLILKLTLPDPLICDQKSKFNS